LVIEGLLIRVVDGLFRGGFLSLVGLGSGGWCCRFITIVGVEPGNFFPQDRMVGACYLMPVVVPEADKDASCVEPSVVVITID